MLLVPGLHIENTGDLYASNFYPDSGVGVGLQVAILLTDALATVLCMFMDLAKKYEISENHSSWSWLGSRHWLVLVFPFVI